MRNRNVAAHLPSQRDVTPFSQPRGAIRRSSYHVGVVILVSLVISASVIGAWLLFSSTHTETIEVHTQIFKRNFPLISELQLLPHYPVITILTTLVKADAYIDGYLENMANQTWPFKSTEILLLNIDGLVSDYVIAACRRAQKHMPHLQLLNLPRVSLYEGWNLAIEQSRGDFITVSNPDDRRHPNSLERHAVFLLQNQKFDIVGSAVVATRVPNQELHDALLDPDAEVTKRHSIFRARSLTTIARKKNKPPKHNITTSDDTFPA